MSSLGVPTEIVSIGYEGRDIDDFVAALVAEGVEVVVDVRLTPISRKKGFSKTALSNALAERDIEYRHERHLGNPKENRDPFRQGKRSARTRYARHLTNGASPAVDAVLELARDRRVALLCFEREHETCHRSCIIERLVEVDPTAQFVAI